MYRNLRSLHLYSSSRSQQASCTEEMEMQTDTGVSVRRLEFWEPFQQAATHTCGAEFPFLQIPVALDNLS